MMRCIICGNLVPPGATHCPICGARTDNAREESFYPPNG
ncbi:MAG: hypothetical protein IH607_07230, partial [Firmicutes bacterium]|nr:hypothetical protein [Bacillota bacterium]